MEKDKSAIEIIDSIDAEKLHRRLLELDAERKATVALLRALKKVKPRANNEASD